MDLKKRYKRELTHLKLNHVYDELEKTDFFKAPASAHYHGSYVGGLAEHSLKVAELLVSWTYKLDIEWVRPRSPLLIGLLHDVCKIGCYTTLIKEDGKVTYTHTDKITDEHGLLSVKMLTDWGVELTDEERICIHYHMGQWTKDIDESLGDLSYNQAIKQYPNLLWVHTADMYASQILNI